MMNRPKIEECTREITSYELDGSETKQKVTDLKKYSFNLERYCDQLENEIKSLKENFADCIKENKRLKKSFNESIDMLVSHMKTELLIAMKNVLLKKNVKQMTPWKVIV